MTTHGQRFRRRALRRGYKIDEVDAFLDRVEATLAGEPIDNPVTAQEVRDVEFRVRFGGYDEWQVDLHLDRLERQLAEAAERGTLGRMEARTGPQEDHTGGLGLGDPTATTDLGDPTATTHLGDPTVTAHLAPTAPHPGSPPPHLGGPTTGVGRPPQAVPTPMGAPATDTGYHGFHAPSVGGYGDDPYQQDMTTEMHLGGPHGSAGIPAPNSPAPPYTPGPYVPPAPPPPGRHTPAAPLGPLGSPVRAGQPVSPMGGPPGMVPPAPTQPGPPTGPLPPVTGPVGGPPHGGGIVGQPGPMSGLVGDAARVDELRRAFQPRRFGSGYDRAQVDQLFDDLVAGLSGRAPLTITESQLDPRRFDLVPGGYFEGDVDRALREVREILRRR